jgi:hypothetical protein
MAVTQCVPDQAKSDLVSSGRNWTSDIFKVALYQSGTATLDASTTAYTSTGEVTGAGYTAGGQVLTNIVVGQSGDTIYVTWDDPSWLNSSITADTALIYNTSNANHAVAIFTFTPVTTSSSPFTIVFPPVGVSAAITIV